MTRYCLHCGCLLTYGDSEFCSICVDCTPYPVFSGAQVDDGAIEWMCRFLESEGAYDRAVASIPCDARQLDRSLYEYLALRDSAWFPREKAAALLACEFAGFCQMKGIEL